MLFDNSFGRSITADEVNVGLTMIGQMANPQIKEIPCIHRRGLFQPSEACSNPSGMTYYDSCGLQLARLLLSGGVLLHSRESNRWGRSTGPAWPGGRRAAVMLGPESEVLAVLRSVAYRLAGAECIGLCVHKARFSLFLCARGIF